MFTTSDILEKIYQNWWGIALYTIILYVLYIIYRETTRIQEGLQSGNIVISDELKLYACHGIQRSLEANTKLIEGFEKAQAVGSLADTKSLIGVFTSKWHEMDCETLVKENPLPVVHMINADDIREEITERITAKINAEIESKNKAAEEKDTAK
jgi:hypothetical protein